MSWTTTSKGGWHQKRGNCVNSIQENFQWVRHVFLAVGVMWQRSEGSCIYVSSCLHAAGRESRHGGGRQALRRFSCGRGRSNVLCADWEASLPGLWGSWPPPPSPECLLRTSLLPEPEGHLLVASNLIVTRSSSPPQPSATFLKTLPEMIPKFGSHIALPSCLPNPKALMLALTSAVPHGSSDPSLEQPGGGLCPRYSLPL